MKNHEVPAGQNPHPNVPTPVEPAAPDSVIGGNMRQDQVSHDKVEKQVEVNITHREIL